MNFHSPIRVASPRRGVPGASRGRVQGLSLIEVLVSVLVLGIGLLGIAAMQSMALRGGQGSLERTQAVMQTTAIIEAMRVNRANANSYNTLGMRCAVTGTPGLAGNDMDTWITTLQASIGGGAATCGQITGCPGACQITVQWNDQRAGGLAAQQLVTRASL